VQRPSVRFSAHPVMPQELRVMTWNVGYFAITPNKNMRDVDVPVVSEIIQQSGAQVVFLQELGSKAQADAIAATLGAPWHSTAYETGHAGQVIATLSVFPILAHQALTCGDRQAVGVTLQLPAQRPCYTLNLHAPHPVRGIELNAQSIRTALHHTQQQPAAVKLVGGDWNYDFEMRADDPLHALAQAQFADSTYDLGRTYYARTRIDHLFHTPQTLTVQPASSGMGVPPARYALVPGVRDHRPIIVSYAVQ